MLLPSSTLLTNTGPDTEQGQVGPERDLGAHVEEQEGTHESDEGGLLGLRRGRSRLLSFDPLLRFRCRGAFECEREEAQAARQNQAPGERVEYGDTGCFDREKCS